MSNFDHLNNDLLALIVQHLPIKNLLYFIRSHRRIHTLNSSNASWSARAFNNSHISIELGDLNDWVMKSSDYLCSFDTFQSNDTIAVNQRLDKGLISLWTWRSIKHGFCDVLNRWLNEHADELKNWQEFDCDLAKRIIDTRDNPPTTIITLRSSATCEVLTDLNEDVFKLKIRTKPAPSDRTRRILSATPNLRSLSLCVDAARFDPPKLNDLLGLVPNLRSLNFCQCDSDYSHKIGLCSMLAALI